MARELEFTILEEVYFADQNYWAFKVEGYGYVKIYDWGNKRPHDDVIKYILIQRKFFK